MTADRDDAPGHGGRSALLPTTPELIGRLREALDEAHGAWQVDGNATHAVKLRAWKLGLDLGVPGLFPFANRLGREAAVYAENALGARSAHLWPKHEEQSPLHESLFDVAWAQFDGESTDYVDDRWAADHVPSFTRLVLALESELAYSAPRWHVLSDFHKLLCARAELRAIVWARDRVPEGRELLEARLQAADGGSEGWWLFAGWGAGGFEYSTYCDGTRQG